MASFLPAVIQGAGSLIGGIFGGGAAKSAAKVMTRQADFVANQFDHARQQSLERYRGDTNILGEMYDRGSQALSPYQQAGQTGINSLINLLNKGVDLSKDPGYKARMEMGADAVLKNANAFGGILNGGTLKELARYGQDYGSSEYSKAFDREMALGGGLADMGYSASSQQAGLGMERASQAAGLSDFYLRNLLASTAGQGDALMQAANSQAAGILGERGQYLRGFGGVLDSVSNFFKAR